MAKINENNANVLDSLTQINIMETDLGGVCKHTKYAVKVKWMKSDHGKPGAAGIL